MEILHLTRRIFALVGYLLDGHFNSNVVHGLLSFIIFIILIVFELTSAVYVIHHLRIGDIENSLYSGCHASSVISALGSFITIIYHRENVRNLIHGLQKMFDDCADKPSAIFFVRADRFSETFSERAIFGVVGGFIISSVAMAAMSAILNFMDKGHIEPQELFLPFKLSFPFDENTLLNWSYTFCVNLILGSTYALLLTVTVCFFTACGLYIEAGVLHFQSILMNVAKIATEKPKNDKHLKLKRCLIEAVDSHNTTKRIFATSRDLMSGTIFFQLVMGVVFISITSFSLEMAWNRMDLGVLTMLSAVLGSIGAVFLYCFIGSMSTDQFIDFGHRSYEFEWYKLPNNLQKIIQLIIIDAQQPQIYTGFNIIDLNLPAFAKIMKTVITYYMMLKSLAK